MSSPDVLVVGSLNLDFVFRAPQLPTPGQTLLGGQFATHPGGKGGNQAVTIGRLGGSVAFAGCVGDDPFGQVMTESLLGAGVDTTHLAIDPSTASGSACVLVDERGMNMIVVAPGANMSLGPDMVLAALACTPKVVLAQLEIEMTSVEAAAQAEFFILNPAPAQDLSSGLLSRCKVLTPNESELKSLTGIYPNEPSDCVAAAASLLDAGVENVIVTLGSRGSYWVSRSSGRHFQAPSVKAIDTTAAGDAFNGALALFLAEGRDMANAIALANCVGALSTTRHGAQESMPSRDELAALAGKIL